MLHHTDVFRTEEDVDILLEFTQHLKAFTNMTLSVRRALVATMVFAVVEKAGKETHAERRLSEPAYIRIGY